MSMSQPVNRAANRTFCPRLPIASDSWSSFTTTVARPSSKQSDTSATSAGFSALLIRICEDSFQRTMSIFSPPSSSTMFLIRLPRTPTHAPTASTFESIELTAILVRWPGFRHLALEQPADQLRVAAREDDLDRGLRFADLHDQRLHPLAHLVLLAGD